MYPSIDEKFDKSNSQSVDMRNQNESDSGVIINNVATPSASSVDVIARESIGTLASLDIGTTYIVQSSDLGASDFSTVINGLLAIYHKIIVPVGVYTLNSTITIPVSKTLLLSGTPQEEYFWTSAFQSYVTTINIASNVTTAFKVMDGASLIGGYISAKTMTSGVVVRMNIFEERHVRDTIQTTLIGPGRATGVCGILLECDGKGTGYGVFINMNCYITDFGTAIWLHRHTSSIWVTSLKIGGYAKQCQRYIYFDTLGNWCGDSSIVDMDIQAGVVPNVSIAAIELNSVDCKISSTLWDIGALGGITGGQQYAIKLNSLCDHLTINSNITYNEILGDLSKLNLLNYTKPFSNITKLNGLETWEIDVDNTTNTIRFYCTALGNNRYFGDALSCDLFPYISMAILENMDNEGCGYSGGKFFEIRILKSKLTTLNSKGFRTWLTTHNVTVKTSEKNFSISITSIPSYIGQESLVGGIWYKAVGTSAITDWKQITN
jgi:hypothetical protein